MKVYIVVEDFGYEGQSAPLLVTTNKALADAYADHPGYSRLQVYEKEVVE